MTKKIVHISKALYCTWRTVFTLPLIFFILISSIFTSDWLLRSCWTIMADRTSETEQTMGGTDRTKEDYDHILFVWT